MNKMAELTLKVFNRLLAEAAKSGEINIFDFDDTLVRTDSRIYLRTEDGEISSLTPHEYATYEPQPGDKFDFSEFEDVKDPEPIMHMLLKMKMAIRDLGLDNVFVLTARGYPKPIQEFLEGVGVSGVRIVALGTSDPAAKAEAIRKEITSRGVTSVKFFDDSAKNIAAVKELRSEFPGVQILAMRIK